MATNYTTLLGLALPTTGELDGTWGTTVNNSITQLVEDAIAKTATASVSVGDWTLTTTGSGAANEARCAILIPTGTPGTSRNIIAPAKSKSYLVINRSDDDVVIKTSTSTGVTIASGTKTTVAYDATSGVEDFVEIAPPAGGSGTVTSVAVSGGTTGLTTSGGPITTSGTITIAGTLAVANGGTGSTTASGARTALGLGSMATQDSSSVSISGGSATLSSATISTVTLATGEYLNASSDAIRVYTNGTFNARFLQSSSRQALALSSSILAGIAYDSGSGIVGVGFDTTNGVNFVGNSSGGYVEFVLADVRKPGGGTFNASSDARLKENVVDYSKSLTDINALRPVTYNYIDTGKYGSKTYTGLIAQEVEQTGLASMVTTGADGYKILDTSELIFALINAVKELSAEVQSLKAQINGG